jgi:hypothetical protein
VPQTVLTGLFSFILFTKGGTALARSSLTGRTGAMVLITSLGAIAAVLRRQRLRSWQEATLEFEDQLPSDVNPLRLSSD